MKTLLESFEIARKLPIAKYKVIESEKDLEKLDYPVFLKADIVGHKTEKKAVVRCNNVKEAKEAFSSLKKFKEKVIAQEVVEGIEMIVGLKEDAVFGKMIMVGFGGIHAETQKDVSFRALPIGKEEVEKMLKDLKNYSALASRKKYDVKKLVEVIEKVSKLEVKEADFNPIILNESECLIVDSRIEVNDEN